MSDTTTIDVDLNGRKAPLRRFWRSTGFSPAELLLEPEMQQTLAHVGGVPRRGIEFVRVHYMLDLVTAGAFGRYDWSLLDEALDAIVEHRLRPFFELMGNPSRLFTDFRDASQAHHWRDFIAALAGRCRERYGVEEVGGWYFETWNEPDIWWRLGGEEGFNNYYDACSEALKAVDPHLRFGGPGTARTLAPMFKSILAHCDTGENLFTGERGVRLDFISVHEKGVKKHAEDLTPNSLGIVAREMKAVDYIRQNHPRFAALPFINNECDPQIGWFLSHTWRGTPYFAGLVAKIVDQHQRLMVEGESIDYELLSNDNGFVGRWGQRTLMAYFGGRDIVAAQSEHLTDLEALAKRRADPAPFELIKKPALSVMELLAFLGDEKLPIEGDQLDLDANGHGAIATPLEGGGAAVLLYNSVDRIWQSGTSRIRLTFQNVPPGTYARAVFRIEPGAGDPFSVWEAQGAPDSPNAEELAEMRRAQEPSCSVETLDLDGSRGETTLTLDLVLPSVALVVLAPRQARAPEAPGRPKVRSLPGPNGAVNNLIFWDSLAYPGVQLFDVLHARDETGPFEVVSPGGLLSTAFVHATGDGKGCYRVRARDLFDREGPDSEPSPPV